MSKKWFDCFNTKFNEFVSDLISIYPSDKDFKLLKNSFNLLRLADTKKPFELFIRYADIYENHIITRDETFFLQHDFNDVIKTESNFTDELMKKLKSYWKEMSTENKDIIWNYLNLFFSIKNKVSNIS